jgi:hypothetical protein
VKLPAAVAKIPATRSRKTAIPVPPSASAARPRPAPVTALKAPGNAKVVKPAVKPVAPVKRSAERVVSPPPKKPPVAPRRPNPRTKSNRASAGRLRILTVTANNGVPTNYPAFTDYHFEGAVLVIEGVPKTDIERWGEQDYSIQTGQRIILPLHLIARVVDRIAVPVKGVVTARQRRTA